jgi:hypothetical protein
MTARRMTMTRHAGPYTRVRDALEDALAPELAIDNSGHARESIEAAGLGNRAERYGDEVDLFLDELASKALAQYRPLAQERDQIHQAANDGERDRLARAHRVNGTFPAGAIA